MKRLKLIEFFQSGKWDSIEIRFWKYVDISEGQDACWNWIGSKHRKYGMLNIGRRPEKASRISFLIANRYLPSVVRHSCDNAGCCNPKHLLGGTQADNIRDMVERGRVAHRKLTEELVIEARTLRSDGWSICKLARRFSVNHKTIAKALDGRSWKHVRTTPNDFSSC